MDLGVADLGGSEEEAVHVGQLNFIIVIKDQFSDAASGEHLSGDRSDASHSDDQCAFVLDILNYMLLTA